MDQLHAGRVFQRQATFKMLRRLHEHNLENKGLNNLSEAFQNFVTRAKFFSIGRLRRTWSHSAVEFMKYRRLLPMLVGDEHDAGNVFDDFDEFVACDPASSAVGLGLPFTDRPDTSSSTIVGGAQDERKIFVSNVSTRATKSQLQSFFSKFGKVQACHIPADKSRREISLYATLPRHPKKWHGICVVTFKSAQSATKAKRASSDELVFYGQQMHLGPNASTGIMRRRAGSAQLSTRTHEAGEQQLQQQCSTTVDGGATVLSRTSSASSMTSTMSNCSGLTLTSTQCGLNLSELPERALVVLLHYVGPIDRIRFERVNKSWLEASASAWLNTERLLFGEDLDLVHFFCSRRPLRHVHLNILRRCGNTLKVLSLAGVNHLLDDRAIIELGTLCPNLVEMDLSGVVASPEALRVLTESLPSLRSLAYREMVHTNERAFWFLFKAVALHMRVVDLRGCARLRGRFFKLLPVEWRETTNEALNFDEFAACDPASSAVGLGLPFTDRPDTSSSTIVGGAQDERKIFVSNVSTRATKSQLQSFFSKFGKVQACHIPADKSRREISLYATLPRHPKKWHGICVVTFKSAQSATKAKRASSDELVFYGQQMHLGPNASTGIMRRRAGSAQLSTRTHEAGEQQLQQQCSTTVDGGATVLSRTSSASSMTSTMSNCSGLKTGLETDKNQRFETLTSTQCGLNLSELPERALVVLLHYVGPIDRIRFERVNKSWLEASASAWLNTERLLFGEDLDLAHFFCSRRPLRHVHLNILRRCGNTLKVLSLAGVNHLLDDRAIIELGTLCPNLVEMDLSGVVASPEALRVLTESLPSLRSLAYREMVHTNERAFWFLFKAVALHMRVVDLRGCARLRGRFFKLFGNELEEVLLDGCRQIDDQLIEDLCNRCCCLRMLKLDRCSRLSDESLSLISRHLKQLDTLTLCGDFPKFSNALMVAHLPRITSLQSLSLDYNCLVNDTLLVAIAEGLPALRTFSCAFAGTDKSISPEGLSRLAKLKRIENLDLSGIAAVNNAVLTTLCGQCAQLKRILLRSCSYLGPDGVAEFRCLKNVEHIDLSGCILVSTDCVQTLCNAFKKDDCDLKMSQDDGTMMISLVVGGTVCESHRLRVARSSRVVLDFSDNSALGTNARMGAGADLQDLLLGGKHGDNGDELEEDEDDDEFRILSAHRTFMTDALFTEEEPLHFDDEQSVLEWAKREAVQLGLLGTTDPQTSTSEK
uniref:RNA-binding protein EEED8.10 n=1 Tax=Globodera pallida TaxID=36090 RepID=A0A183BPK5_GLOPA